MPIPGIQSAVPPCQYPYLRDASRHTNTDHKHSIIKTPVLDDSAPCTQSQHRARAAIIVASFVAVALKRALAARGSRRLAPRINFLPAGLRMGDPPGSTTSALTASLQHTLSAG